MSHLPSVAPSRRAAFLLGILAVFASAVVVSAASYVKTSLQDLTHNAVAVAEVEIMDRQYPAMKEGQTFPRTDVQAKVIRTLKGSLPELITIDIPGGILNNVISCVPDGANFKIGERAMVFLKNLGSEPSKDRFMVQDLGLGKFNLVERDQQRFVESPLCPRAMESSSAVDPTGAGKAKDLEANLILKSIPYDSFCQLVSSYAAGKTPDVNVVAMAAGLQQSTAHHHLGSPAELTDLLQQRAADSDRSALWMLLGGITLTAVLALAWVLYRRRKNAQALQTRSIVTLLGAALLVGASAGSVSHAFVPFPNNTIWNLDKPISGKVASNKIIWRQSIAVSKTNANVFSSVQAAYDTWASVSGSRLAFTAGGSTTKIINNSSDAENIIAWTSTPGSDFSVNTLAITFSSYTIGSTSNFVDGDIIFNDRDFDWSATGHGNVRSVALHEIGHFIGLNHTTDTNTVMYPFDQGFIALKPDEILAAQTLYPGSTVVTAPVITSVLTASGNVGTPFSYTITASGTTPITYTASPLPAGLKLTGAIIAGIPTTTGVTSVVLGASNGTLPNDSKTLVITIAPVGTIIPTITSMQVTPSPAKVSQLVTATGAATVSTGTVSYSWNFGDGSTEVAGATATHTYSTPATYSVSLTATASTGGMSTSQSVLLIVDAKSVVSGLTSTLTFKNAYTVKDVVSKIDGPTEVNSSTLNISAKIPLPTDTTVGDSDTLEITAGNYSFSETLSNASKFMSGKSYSFNLMESTTNSSGVTKDVKVGTISVRITTKGMVTVTLTDKGSSAYDSGIVPDIVAAGLFGTTGVVVGNTPITISIGRVTADFNPSYTGKGSVKTDKNNINVGSVSVSGSDKLGTVSQ